MARTWCGLLSMMWIIIKVQLYCEKELQEGHRYSRFFCAEEACLSMEGMSVEMLYSTCSSAFPNIDGVRHVAESN